MSLIAASLCSCGGRDGSTKSPATVGHPRIWSMSMNKICKEWDGQWQGMTVASDGNCYL